MHRSDLDDGSPPSGSDTGSDEAYADGAHSPDTEELMRDLQSVSDHCDLPIAEIVWGMRRRHRRHGKHSDSSSATRSAVMTPADAAGPRGFPASLPRVPSTEQPLLDGPALPRREESRPEGSAAIPVPRAPTGYGSAGSGSAAIPVPRGGSATGSGSATHGSAGVMGSVWSSAPPRPPTAGSTRVNSGLGSVPVSERHLVSIDPDRLAETIEKGRRRGGSSPRRRGRNSQSAASPGPGAPPCAVTVPDEDLLALQGPVDSKLTVESAKLTAESSCSDRADSDLRDDRCESPLPPPPKSTADAPSTPLSDGGLDGEPRGDSQAPAAPGRPRRRIQFTAEVTTTVYEVDSNVYISIEYARPFVGWFCLVFSALLHTFGGVIAHYFDQAGRSPYVVATWSSFGQLFLAATLVAGYAVTVRELNRSDRRHLTQPLVWLQLGVVCTMFAMMRIAAEAAQHMTGATREMSCVVVHPLLVAVFGAVFKNTVFKEELCGVCFLIAGFFMAMMKSDVEEKHWAFAEVVSLCQGIYIASFIFSATRARTRVPIPLLFLFLSVVFAALQLAVSALERQVTFDADPRSGVFGFWQQGNIVGFVFLAVCDTFGWAGLLTALKFLPPITVSVVIALRPILTVFGVHAAFYAAGSTPDSAPHSRLWHFLAQHHDPAPTTAPLSLAGYTPGVAAGPVDDWGLPAALASLPAGTVAVADLLTAHHAAASVPTIALPTAGLATHTAGMTFFFGTPAPTMPPAEQGMASLFKPLFASGAVLCIVATIFLVYISSIRRQKVDMLLEAYSRRRKPRNPFRARRGSGSSEGLGAADDEAMGTKLSGGPRRDEGGGGGTVRISSLGRGSGERLPLLEDPSVDSDLDQRGSSSGHSRRRGSGGGSDGSGSQGHLAADRGRSSTDTSRSGSRSGSRAQTPTRRPRPGLSPCHVPSPGVAHRTVRPTALTRLGDVGFGRELQPTPPAPAQHGVGSGPVSPCMLSCHSTPQRPPVPGHGLWGYAHGSNSSGSTGGSAPGPLSYGAVNHSFPEAPSSSTEAAPYDDDDEA